MKLFIALAMLTSLTSAFANCNSMFNSGYELAVKAEQACQEAKKIERKVDLFFNSHEENCELAKTSQAQYDICKIGTLNSINYFKKVTRDCTDFNLAQQNIGILESFLSDIEEGTSSNQNLIRIYCK